MGVDDHVDTDIYDALSLLRMSTIVDLSAYYHDIVEIIYRSVSRSVVSVREYYGLSDEDSLSDLTHSVLQSTELQSWSNLSDRGGIDINIVYEEYSGTNTHRLVMCNRTSPCYQSIPYLISKAAAYVIDNLIYRTWRTLDIQNKDVGHIKIDEIEIDLTINYINAYYIGSKLL